MESDNKKGFATKAIHQGLKYRDQTGSVIPPIYATSTFAAGNSEGFDYTRSGNPNFKNLEAVLASLEHAEHACVFANGVAAITAIVSSLHQGALVLAEENLYGSTYRLFEQVFKKFGLEVKYLDFSDSSKFSVIEETKPALVWLESPTNPLLKIVDIEKISSIAKKVASAVVVDNTFASSFFQCPLKLGATLSLLSTTKYVNGHSDCLGGVVCTSDASWQAKMTFAQKALGLNPSPFDTWLIARGAKTLELRMKKHEENALELAKYLEVLPCVSFVRYPFLVSHPQYELAKRQMSGGSGMLSLEFKFSLEKTRDFLNQLKLFTLAESLGGVESLVCHPATMTHASVPKAVREAVGLSDALVRFSVGIEHVEDLIADISCALKAVGEA